MATLRLTDEQVIELFKQLPSDRKREVLFALAEESQLRRNNNMIYAESQLRRLCTERGLNWDSMNEDQRELFIDDLIHEDR
jgi:hypothetical protein